MSRERKQGYRIRIRGIVQGVGFRPHVFRLAKDLGLTGTIANTSSGVVIEVHGPRSDLTAFLDRLRRQPPPASRIMEMEAESVPFSRQEGFSILPSRPGLRPDTQVAPDIGLCADCLRELFDPADRRYRYPFINCTNCGPRYSIIAGVPYDRPATSMAPFLMCPECEREYHDPGNRRFHAQPNGCPACGPSLSWHDRNGQHLPVRDPVEHCVQALSRGQVVALRGLGGFHLAVDATRSGPVNLLRQRKHRPEKPLAIMVRDLSAARRFCRIDDTEARALSSSRAPIVLLERREGTLPETLAPGLGMLGLMLPYTPLHHLLLAHPECPEALVMTSGNLSGEPICIGNREAVRRLAGVADFFLLHNREILTRVDDSVLRVMAGKPRLFRRGRGYTPEPVLLEKTAANALGCGAEMKATFCLVRGRECFLSQHIGDLTSPECLDFYRESLEHMQDILDIRFDRVACDLHPDYLSTRFAEHLPATVRRIQHHHAHAAAVMAEHGLDPPVLALVFDGAGHGPDSTVFGGEFFRVGRTSYERLGRLPHLPLPGGDRAAREPWRMGLALLSLLRDKGRLAATLLAGIDVQMRETVQTMIRRRINTPLTSSCGRLFDGVAALTGLCLKASYEGQAAMLVEAAANAAYPASSLPVPIELSRSDGLLVPDLLPFLDWLIRKREQGCDAPLLAAGFHRWLIRVSLRILQEIRIETGIRTLVLSGGAMQNRLLLEGLLEGAASLGLSPYSGERIPVNDGGLALGQAFLAGLKDIPDHNDTETTNSKETCYVPGHSHAGSRDPNHCR